MKSDLAKIHHARSIQDFPDIDLEADEWVVLHVARAKIGLMLIWASEVLGLIVLTVALCLLTISGDNALGLNSASVGYLYLVIFALFGVLFISGIIGTTIYKSNHLYITNRRVVQKTRPSLFSNSTNIIDLKGIEDVSFRQSGILDYILKLGTIRMSTVGDETTYTFPFVENPKDEIKTITHLVHQAKNNQDIKPES